MDKSFILELETLELKMEFDEDGITTVGMGFGFVDGYIPNDEELELLKVLSEPITQKFTANVVERLIAGKVEDDLALLIWNIEIAESFISLDCAIEENAEPSPELNVVVPKLDELSTELFLDMIDELGGVMGTLHQQTKPTFEFIISKEVETV